MRGLRDLLRWLRTGRKRSELTCPYCRVVNVVTSRVGDEIECGACGTRFFHGR